MPHAYRIARISEDLEDVLREVREEVTRILVPALGNAVNHPTPAGVNQASQELARVLPHDGNLPGGKNDRAPVLGTDAVLREDTRPVLPIRIHVEAPDLRCQTDALHVAVSNASYRLPAFEDDPPIAGVQRDPKFVHPRMAGDVPVSEVEPQQVGVGLFFDESAVASRTSGRTPRKCFGGPFRRQPRMVVRLMPVARET
jgi:hypothetical protein